MILVQTSTRKDIRQQHIVDVADVCQVAVPVEGIGVPTFNLGIHRITRQTMLPEDGLLKLLKVGLVPHIGTQFAPTWAPRMEVGLINGKALGIGLRNKLWLAWGREYLGGIDWLAQTHVIIASNRIAVGLVVNVVLYLEVHTTAHILYYQSVTTRFVGAKVDIPYIGTYQTLTAGFFLGS